ncbi:MAG: FAD-dependent oxidoreductase [Candidatus Omnitrophica bacterium]|nr:FAD-dependent oxidoreductase [Candidatus Omnitrophota bacterium]
MVIVGAGITGLVLGHELLKNGYRVTILEKEAVIGGLIKTFNYNGNGFDIGPHRIYSSDSKVQDYLYQVLGEDLIKIERKSFIYSKGRYFNWPLLFREVFKLSFKEKMLILRDLVFNITRQHKTQIDFAGYIKNNYGETIYKIFFHDLVAKFLSLPASDIHWSWAKSGIEKALIDEKIYSRNLKDLFYMVLKSGNYSMDYFYPRKGIGLLSEKLSELVKKSGGIIKNNTRIKSLERKDGIIKKIILEDESIEPYLLVWTGNLNDLSGLVGLKEEWFIYHPIAVYALFFKNKYLRQRFQWCYYSGSDISFYRLSMPEVFSKDLVNSNTSTIIAECSFDENHSFDNHVAKIINDLKNVSVIEESCQPFYYLRKDIKDAYPVYALDYIDRKDKFFEYMKCFKNLKFAGRGGLFWYNNIDECIINAFQTAKDISS